MTIFSARVCSFSLVCCTSTIRFWYALPVRTMEPVEIMFKISFCAVPDLSRVEPVSTSGPQFTSMASSAALPMALPMLQAMAAVWQPTLLA